MEPLREALGAYPKSTPTPKTSGGIDWRERDYRVKLRERGYAPNPYCTVCGGAGFVHPRSFDGNIVYNRTEPCEAPECLVESKLAWQKGEGYLKSKGLSVSIQTFENFDRSVKGTGDAYDAFYRLAHEHNPPFLLCYGTTGNGKTHLAEAAVRVLNQDGIDTRYYTVEGMVQQLKMSISEDKTEVVVKNLSGCPGLVFDDWGVEYGTDWEMSKLEYIIDCRYREQLITVVISNKDLRQLNEKSVRIVSRFSDQDMSRIVLNEAIDYRGR